jgi:hypothetical protein
LLNAPPPIEAYWVPLLAQPTPTGSFRAVPVAAARLSQPPVIEV